MSPARLSALGNGDAVLGQKVVDDPFLMNVNKTADENENLSWGLTAELNWTISDNLTFTSVSAYRDFEDLNNPDVDGTPANGDNLIMPIVNVSTTGPSPSSGLSTHSWQVYNEYFTQEFRLTGTEGNVDWIAGIFYQDYEEHILGEVPLLIIDGFYRSCDWWRSSGRYPRHPMTNISCRMVHWIMPTAPKLLRCLVTQPGM